MNRFLNALMHIKFRYYFYDSERKNYSWLDEWDKVGLPQAVKVELEIT